MLDFSPSPIWNRFLMMCHYFWWHIIYLLPNIVLCHFFSLKKISSHSLPRSWLQTWTLSIKLEIVVANLFVFWSCHWKSTRWSPISEMANSTYALRYVWSPISEMVNLTCWSLSSDSFMILKCRSRLYYVGRFSWSDSFKFLFILCRYETWFCVNVVVFDLLILNICLKVRGIVI